MKHKIRPKSVATDEPMSDTELAEFKEILQQGTVRFSPEALEGMEKLGLTKDEVLSMLHRTGGLEQ